MPRLTIGLIIYNGADSARRCIDSLLAQTFQDFELLIHDNGSTDGTSEICAEYPAHDARVRHVRHANTIPQSTNFRGVLMAARTEFFMWAADDDIWGKRFAEMCITELDNHPEAVAACTRVLFTYPDGSDRMARGTFPIRGTPTPRIKTYLSNPRDSARLYGVYRTPALQRSYPADINMFAYDWVVVALTMLEGDHLEADGQELIRSGHMPGKYFEKYSRHFVREPGLVGRLSYFLPLLPFAKELKLRLPASVWRAVFWKVIRLNLHQSLMLLKWKFPVAERLFRAVRAMDRAVGNS
jgi:glycosyltransferase involved in cell wall biosynthesis